ncbi:MAG: flagellar motor protein MotB [Lachnospiraceae bacterium]|nr:flagellar motor protein MotB [Lachnospiraceae bacterium]
MAKKRREDDAPPPALWKDTFADLMNLLLCFFVLLFASATIEEDKWEEIAQSFNSSFSIFSGGASAIGDGILVSNGVSQLNQLDEYINTTGKTADNEEAAENFDEIQNKMEEAQLEASEELAELVEEAIAESNLSGDIDIEFTSQFVQLTLNGAVLFDSGSVELKENALPILDKVGSILERYSSGIIEIEGHTDNVPMSGAKYSNNDELSNGRALSVFNYVISNTNLDPADIKHAGRGEYVPIADNSTPEGRAKNRRVEIRIYNSLSSYQ